MVQRSGVQRIGAEMTCGLAVALPRRLMLRLLAAGIPAGLLGQLDPEAALARCVSLGKKCGKRGKKRRCCGGAKCKRGRCRCTGGSKSCGEQCVPPGVLACFAGEWGSEGGANGQFRYPVAVAAAPDGSIYVTDWENNRIQQFTASGAFIRRWGRNGGDGAAGSADGEFDSPHGVAVGQDGSVYVADTGNDRVQKFDGAGNHITSWPANRALGVAVNATDVVFVTDSSTSTPGVRAFLGRNGGLIAELVGAGTGDGQFSSPEGVALTPGGRVYVADTENHRVQELKFDGTLTFTRKWGRNGGDGSSGAGAGEFDEPGGVAVGDDGRVFVADSGNNRIQVFTADGGHLGAWGSFGTGEGEFAFPTGVATRGRVAYVAGGQQHRIQWFQLV